jgi:hypothetical protein
MEGYFLSREAGTYNFSTNSDDGSFLWIDTDTQPRATNHQRYNCQVDNGGLHTERTEDADVVLSANKHYFIRIIYGDRAQKNIMEMRLRTPNGNISAGVGFLFDENSVQKGKIDIKTKDKLLVAFENNNTRFYIDKDGVSLGGNTINTITNKQWGKLTNLRVPQIFVSDYKVFNEDELGLNQMIFLLASTRSDAENDADTNPRFTGIELPSPQSCQGQVLHIFHRSDRTLFIDAGGDFLGKREGSQFNMVYNDIAILQSSYYNWIVLSV